MAGLAVAGYLTLVHFAQGAIPLACSSAGLVDCERVTSSAQSSVGPVPVAVLGVLWFVGLLALLLGEGRGDGDGNSSGQAARGLSARLVSAQLGWTALGLVVVLYLVYAELFLIGAICSWCTVLHVLIVGLFLLTLFRWAGGPDRGGEMGRPAGR